MSDKRKLWFHSFLFLLTFITATIAGALHPFVTDPEAGILHLLAEPRQVLSGLPFAITLMVILLVHEMGHYLMSRYHGVDATLPYFIPAPPFPFIIGTFGAFIKMKSAPRDRRSLFDVGAAGPLAGLALAIPAVIVGLKLSTVASPDSTTGGPILGSSALFSFLVQLTLDISPDKVNLVLHPIAVAGWVGLLVTMMNLLPVGQLDGGHVVYALFGRRHIWISWSAVGAILLLGLLRLWDGWIIWGLLLLFMGARHPAPLDPHTPLDLKRQLVAWLTIAVFAVTFIPIPFSFQEPSVRQERLEPEPAAAPLVEARLHGGPL